MSLFRRTGIYLLHWPPFALPVAAPLHAARGMEKKLRLNDNQTNEYEEREISHVLSCITNELERK